MRLMTLIFLVRGDDILLAQKKRGFGEGHWNGAGGKVESDETVEQALVRECQEEIEVTPTSYEQVALLTFDVHYKGRPEVIEMHTFKCTEWKGEPTETEEMKPQWFKKSEIPYDQMWEDDKFWLPLVLQGKKLKGNFKFDEYNYMLDYAIEEVENI